jgi:N-acetylmuramoyl-L-alanine amidase
VRVFKLVCFCLAAVLLAGCAGNSVKELPPSEPVGTNVVHQYPVPTPPPVNTPTKPIQPIPSTVVPNKPLVTSPPVTTWTALSDWTSAHGLSAAKRIPDLPVAEYAIHSENGTMVLEIGSLEATWNGVIINLGFAPQFIDGEVCLHELDLEKNLGPLLCTPPLTFSTNRVIVIDPGHGGHNVGTQSVLDGRHEKEFTLDLALRLKPLLVAEGWKVFLTRTEDTDVSLPDRVAFAQENKADLFISLHFNSGAPDTKQAGLETYCSTPTGMPSTVTRNFADPWTETVANNAFDPENLQLAVRIHSALLHGTGILDRGVRRARFIGVLRGQSRPAILIEAGYLSNPDEATRIETPAYRQKLAEVLAQVLAPTSEDKK